MAEKHMALKNNVDHYMELKGIKNYSQLLTMIARHLNIKGQDAYEFVRTEKSNFSKMLKGERPLKYQFIIPLEKIFGVSLARMLDEESYKLPVERNNVPANIGFRYLAYLDDPEAYRGELNTLFPKSVELLPEQFERPISRVDEFGKTFIDYVIEYNSVNCVRYLYDEYGMNYKGILNRLEFTKEKIVITVNPAKQIEFARLVANMNDTELFNGIFDSYYLFFMKGYYLDERCIFNKSDYLEIILDNDNLFDSIFEIRPYELKAKREPKGEMKVTTHYIINPIINNCLRHSLEHLDKYYNRAVDILKFGIKHNERLKSEGDYYTFNELGGLVESDAIEGNIDNIVDVAVFIDREVEVNDDKINSLIERLPKFLNPNKGGIRLQCVRWKYEDC